MSDVKSKVLSDEEKQAQMERILKSKHDHRVELANLPFRKKVRIVVELQQIGNALAKAAGRKPKKVWKI